MADSTVDPIAAARLLRELAEALLQADGPARNGLFLELHRLLDTLFRLSLEAHPAAPPELAAQAFSLADPLPAPQVVRELNRLGSELAAPEIRGLYKHMNTARNNMAHEAVVARVVVSHANSKRMARLARLVADTLDPAREGTPERAPDAPAPARRSPRLRYLSTGLALGLALGWAWSGALPPALTLAVTVITLTLAGALFLLDL